MKHGQSISDISPPIYTYTRQNKSKQSMAKQSENGEESYELQQLRPEVEKLFGEFDALAENPPNEGEMKVLAEISKVLEQIKARIAVRDDGKQVKDDDVLPQSKRKELHNLVRLISAALAERGAAQPAAAESSAAADSQPAPAPATTGCIPCMPRASKQQKQQQDEQQQQEKEGVSLTLLLQLTKNVLEPEQYYEWTTSYVDEERIYGWDKEAGEVMDALVAPDGGGSERMFRAAGIAGIHGSGKTALAQKVFVHDKAKDNFALRLWVCVGPPDSEDRFNLLYRMLDNLGLDTSKVEYDIVENSKVVVKARKEERARIMEKQRDAIAELRKKAADMVAKRRAAGVAGQKQNQAAETAAKKETPSDDAPKKEGNVVTEAGAAGGDEDANRQAKEEEGRVFEELLKEKIDNSRAVEKSKIGVLLYILHMTLSKTSYMIVFDDIRAYRRDDDGDGDDGCWYSNLTLEPPAEGEWGDRLGYGLPKGEHRGAVLVTCRKEDDAKTMARTGLVVRPPKLQGDDAWKLFRREYDQAKDDRRKKEGSKAEEEDLLLKQLEEMEEDIMKKCLGLPVAIIEAARGFAGLDPLPDLPDDTASATKEAAAEVKPAAAAGGGHTQSSKDMDKQLPEGAEAADDAEPDEDK